MSVVTLSTPPPPPMPVPVTDGRCRSASFRCHCRSDAVCGGAPSSYDVLRHRPDVEEHCKCTVRLQVPPPGTASAAPDLLISSPGADNSPTNACSMWAHRSTAYYLHTSGYYDSPYRLISLLVDIRLNEMGRVCIVTRNSMDSSI